MLWPNQHLSFSGLLDPEKSLAILSHPIHHHHQTRAISLFLRLALTQGNYSLHSFSVLRLVKPQHSNGNAASHYMINECLTALGEKTTQKTSNGWIIEPVPGARREALGKAPPVPGSRHASCSAGPAWLLGTAGMGSPCVSELKLISTGVIFLNSSILYITEFYFKSCF